MTTAIPRRRGGNLAGRCAPQERGGWRGAAVGSEGEVGGQGTGLGMINLQSNKNKK